MNRLLKKLAMAASLGMTLFIPISGATQGAAPMVKTAQNYIDAFRRGEDFSRPVEGLVRNYQVNKVALSVLTKELATGTPEVREKLVRLLEEMALEANAPDPTKFPVVQDPSIIKALLTEGFAKDDAGMDAAEMVLRHEVRPTDLAKYQDIYIKILGGPQAISVLYLVAKAKVLQARNLVEKMAASPQFQDRQSVRIAQAALGNTTVEDTFIAATREAEKNAPPAPKNRFYDVGDAKDGKALVEQLKLLGMIGTRRSLLVACSYARSPLKTYLPDHWERSVRLDALGAIAYNFPDARVLVGIDNLQGYAAAERFCTEHLGSVFEGPTPNLPGDMAYPSM